MENTNINANTNKITHKQKCKFEHQFRPVEKKAAEERVALHIEEVKNAQKQNQYSFDKSIPKVLNGFDSSTQYADVPYSINREYIQLRPGMIYNTVRENCKKEFDAFFKNAGKVALYGFDTTEEYSDVPNPINKKFL